jgi:RNA polymerase sigma-70 factor (ECF subfamily)
MAPEGGEPREMRKETASGSPALPAAGDALQPQADARCIAAVLAGDRQRFGELVERYQTAVLAVVRGRVGEGHAAEDVSQEIFLKAFTELCGLRDPALFFPWLLQIARREAARAGVRDRQRPDRFPLQDYPADSGEVPPGHPENVLALVEQLPEPYRTTVLLKYERGLSCREIAEHEGVAVGTVTSRLARALLWLRTALRE